jgi:HSP20 family protein
MFELVPFDSEITFSPFHQLDEIQKNFLKNFSMRDFKTDIKDNGDSYLLEAELPGFKKEDISIVIDDKFMHIRAERHSKSEEKDKQGNYIRSERSYGQMSRSFNISNVKADQIAAEYCDGVLKLTMPKKEATGNTSRQIQIQ